MARIQQVVTALFVGAILVNAADAASPTSYFRKNHGVTGETAQHLPVDLGDEANLLWRTELASGISTPCVYDDAIYITTFDEEKKELATVALDRASGELRWKQVAPTKTIEKYHPVGSPAASTPACDGERVYSFFGSYGLLCYDLKGTLQWDKRMGPFQDEFGASSSPVLVGDLVILNEDHDLGSYLIAIDKLTGTTVWKTARNGFTRSYSTPTVWEVDGKKQLVVAGALRLTAYDPKDGSVIWWMDGLSRIVDTTPVVADGKLYLATWTPGGDQDSRISMEPFAEALSRYDKDGDEEIAKSELSPGPVLQRFFRIDLDQNEKLNQKEWEAHARVFERAQNVAIAIRPGGKGDITKTHVEWTYRRGLPVVPSPLVVDGMMFMVKDSGIVTSLDTNTGELIKQGRASGRGNYYASPVAGDGKVYLASERGVITVLDIASRDWETLSTHDFKERIMATPVIADGKIYLRTDDALYCFGKKGE